MTIYKEGVRGLDFREIRGFVKEAFGGLKIDLVKPESRIVQTKGLLFDPLRTQKALGAAAAEDTCRIILTGRIFATLDENGRPHIRAGIYGSPSVISLSGIVEGPAKPREFYIYKQKYASMGVWELKEEAVRKRFRGRFIDYGDRRITKVVKGYIAQALFFHVTGDPFCDKRSCRLYNSHWQKDLIYSQITCGRFCRRHSATLRRIRDGR